MKAGLKGVDVIKDLSRTTTLVTFLETKQEISILQEEVLNK